MDEPSGVAAIDRKPVQRTVKRAFDVIVSAAALFLLSPLLLAVAVAILVTMGRPALFRQPRPGLHEELFTVYKFRTMRREAGDDAERLTRLGRWLRATSIDELPQLWNVARGDMSLVGPRPLLVEYLDLYDPDQRRRHDMKPGITGLSQVSGRNELPWARQFQLDVRYVERWSLHLDLLILARTVTMVLRRRGVAQPGRATRDRFGAE